MAEPTIDSFTADIQALRQELRGLSRELSSLAGGGAVGGGSSMMAGSLAPVTNLFGGSSAWAGVSGSDFGSTSRVSSSKFGSIIGGALNAGGTFMQAAGYLTGLMPNMEKYLVRDTGYYQAGLYSMGATARATLAEKTRSGIGTLTSAGSDATVAAILSGRGVNTNSSLYSNLLTSVGNAAKYMNLPNEVAAQSMESLTSGSMSASLLQRGIFTSDPTTGNPLKESQIFEQFANRWMTGSMTVEEVQDELRRGFLGANIDSLNMDTAAKERLKMFMLAKAQGKTLDFTSEQSMTDVFGTGGSLAASGYTNPMTTAYKLAGTETDYINAMSADLAEGFKLGADAVKTLTAELITLSDQIKKTGAMPLGKMAGSLSTFIGSDAGAGFFSGGLAGMGALAALGAGNNTLFQLFTGQPSGSGDFFSGMTSSLANLIGTATGGGGGMYDTSLGSNLAQPTTGGVTAGYGKPGSEFWDGTHNGIDYGVAEGTPVKAAADGTVKTVTTSTLTKGYGLHIVLQHGGGWTTIYAHLSRAVVGDGDSVTKGQVIGYSGSTGTTSPHLHFEVQENGQDRAPSSFPGNTSGTGGGSALEQSLLGGGSYSPLIGSMASTSGGGGLASPVASAATASGGGITINVNVASASEEEARRFALIVKEELEQDSLMSQMGAR